MSDIRELALEVVSLPNGRFAVRSVGGELVDGIVGEFATRAEAEAWILDQALAEDEDTLQTDIAKPGDGQNFA